MKYGQLLRKHSVPEWHAHNILYDSLKYEIKELTACPESFTSARYAQLVDSFSQEIDNANLFVRCKVGEIEYRLQQCDTIVRDLAKQLEDEKIWLLNREVRKLTLDIQNLSRYVEAQLTGFRKLLKKFRRHAPALAKENGDDLSEIDAKLLARDSFASVDLTPQFLELSALYTTLRTRKFAELNLSLRNGAGKHKASPNDSLQFDVEMQTADVQDIYRFWVHKDYLVQLKVLLLQHMDLVAPDSEDEAEITLIKYLDSKDLQFAKKFSDPAQICKVVVGRKESDPVLLVPSVGLRHTAAATITNEQMQAILSNKPVSVDSNAHVSAQLALGWVASQGRLRTVCMQTHRTRFRSSGDKVWAAIDSSAKVLVDDAQGTQEIAAFPFQVLEMRVGKNVAWVDALRNSHLVYPVSGSFSLYLWALIQLRPNFVSETPSWLDSLDSGVNIKREPNDVQPAQTKLHNSKSFSSIKFGAKDDGSPPQTNRGLLNARENEDRPRYWNEFDDGEEFTGGDDFFYDGEDEEMHRARVAQLLATPVYQLGESMRRHISTLFDRRSSESSLDSDTLSVHSSASDDSSVRNLVGRTAQSGQYSPRIRHYGATGEVGYFDLKSDVQRRRNDHGLSLITSLCFLLSGIVVMLVFTLFMIEDVDILPLKFRLALVMFLAVALVLAVSGYVAYFYRNKSSWHEQVLVHLCFLTIVCLGVGGMANVSLPNAL